MSAQTLRPEMFDRSQLIRDALFAAVERRDLQFMFEGEERKGYQAWLKKPKAYKEMVRTLGWF